MNFNESVRGRDPAPFLSLSLREKKSVETTQGRTKYGKVMLKYTPLVAGWWGKDCDFAVSSRRARDRKSRISRLLLRNTEPGILHFVIKWKEKERKKPKFEYVFVFESSQILDISCQSYRSKLRRRSRDRFASSRAEKLDSFRSIERLRCVPSFRPLFSLT